MNQPSNNGGLDEDIMEISWEYLGGKYHQNILNLLGKKDKSSWMIGDNYEDTIHVSSLFGEKRNLTVQLLNSSRSVLIFGGTGKF